MIERDYIMRMMQQLAAAVARLFQLKQQEKYDQALQEVEKAYGELLGLNAPIVSSFDSPTLAQLLGHAGKMTALATLFFEQAELHRLNREPEHAQKFYRRALEMFLEAYQAQAEDDAECRAKIQMLLQLAGTSHLPPRYVEVMRQYRLCE